MIPALLLNFSILLLALFVAVVALLLFRIFVLFPKTIVNVVRRKELRNTQ